MGFMNISLLGDAFSDFHLEDVGVTAYELEHDWFTKEDLVITTGAGGGGTSLSEGVDYQLSGEDTELSARVTAAVGSTRTVYHKVQIINVTYQSGDLYHSGKYIADSNDAEDVVPVGTILPFGGSSAPDGLLLCDGSAISRLTYHVLFAEIGTAFGVGDGSTTFNIPNMQGVSPTGAGAQDINGRTKTGPTLGAVREDEMQGHWHKHLYSYEKGSGTGIIASGVNDLPEYTIQNLQVQSPGTDGVNGTPRTGAYTHGPEIGVNWIIKY